MLYIALVHVVKTRYRFADAFSASSAAKIPPGESLPVHMNYLMKWTQVEIYIVRDRPDPGYSASRRSQAVLGQG